MLCPQSHHYHHHNHPFLRPVTTAIPHRTTTFHHHNHTTCSLSSTPQTPPPSTTQQKLIRTHNKFLPNDTVPPSHSQKASILELSLVTKRTPQFPGSIGNDPSALSLGTLLDNGDGDVEMVLRAIEIRRRVTFEIFVDVMVKKGKFGITYAKNVGSHLGEFLDLVMVQAAGMKKVEEFSRLSFNARARMFVEESHVVPLVRWLKHNSLSYPQIGRMICLSKGNVESIKSRVEWLKSIHVKGRYIGVVFMRVGDTILRRSLEELDEIVFYLESKGLRRDWMGYVMSRCAELLAFSMEEVKTRVSFFMDMGMNEHDFGTMVYDCPKVLGFFSLDEMKEKVNYLKDFGLGDEDVGRILAFKPQLMVCGIEERWKPLLKLLYYLGIDREGMKRMLIIKPMVFCVDLESTIVPKVKFFQQLGIKDDAIGRMLVKFPPLLTYSLYKKIRPVVVFLLTKAGVSQKDIAKVIALAPELLGSSIAHKLDGNVKFFLSLRISLRQLGEMIADFPMLLRYNAELLRPKYRYLRRTMVRPLQDVIEFPRFFSYSLEHKIIPRHRVMVENRVNFKLRYMLTSSDAEFKRQVQAAVERRQRFESGATDSYNPEEDEFVETGATDLYKTEEDEFVETDATGLYKPEEDEFVETEPHLNTSGSSDLTSDSLSTGSEDFDALVLKSS